MGLPPRADPQNFVIPSGVEGPAVLHGAKQCRRERPRSCGLRTAWLQCDDELSSALQIFQRVAYVTLGIT